MKIELGTEQAICRTAAVYGQARDIGVYALAAVANDMRFAGAEEFRVEASIVVPAFAYKSRCHTMEKAIKECCRARGLTLDGIFSEKNPAAALSMVRITGLGRCCTNYRTAPLPGWDIVLTKWIGMEGTLRIAGEKEAELQERFAPMLIRRIQSLKEELFASGEIKAAEAAGVTHVHQITEGGILAALWELAETYTTGLALDMKKISVRQETIEVCEHYRVNPYQLASAGSHLMLAKDGQALVKALADQGVAASVIGEMTDNNDKIIYNGEDIRYIDRPAPDEMIKIFEETKGGH